MSSGSYRLPEVEVVQQVSEDVQSKAEQQSLDRLLLKQQPFIDKSHAKKRAVYGTFLSLVEQPRQNFWFTILFPASQIVLEAMQLMSFGVVLFSRTSRFVTLFYSIFNLDSLNLSDFVEVFLAVAMIGILLSFFAAKSSYRTFFFGASSVRNRNLWILNFLTLPLSTFLFIPCIVFYAKLIFCDLPSVLWECNTPIHFAIAALCIILTITQLIMTVIVTLGAFPEDPNERHILRREHPYFDLITLILKMIMIFVVVAISKSHPTTAVSIYLGIAFLFVIFQILLQPFYNLMINKIRFCLYMGFLCVAAASFAIVFLEIHDENINDLLMVAAPLAVMLISYPILRPQHKSFTLYPWLHRLVPIVTIGSNIDTVHHYNLDSLLRYPSRLGQLANYLADMGNFEAEADRLFSKAMDSSSSGFLSQQFAARHWRLKTDPDLFPFQTMAFEYAVNRLPSSTLICVTADSKDKASIAAMFLEWNRRIREQPSTSAWIDCDPKSQEEYLESLGASAYSSLVTTHESSANLFAHPTRSAGDGASTTSRTRAGNYGHPVLLQRLLRHLFGGERSGRHNLRENIDQLFSFTTEAALAFDSTQSIPALVELMIGDNHDHWHLNATETVQLYTVAFTELFTALGNPSMFSGGEISLMATDQDLPPVPSVGNLINDPGLDDKQDSSSSSNSASWFNSTMNTFQSTKPLAIMVQNYHLCDTFSLRVLRNIVESQQVPLVLVSHFDALAVSRKSKTHRRLILADLSQSESQIHVHVHQSKRDIETLEQVQSMSKAHSLRSIPYSTEERDQIIRSSKSFSASSPTTPSSERQFFDIQSINRNSVAFQSARSLGSAKGKEKEIERIREKSNSGGLVSPLLQSNRNSDKSDGDYSSSSTAKEDSDSSSLTPRSETSDSSSRYSLDDSFSEFGGRWKRIGNDARHIENSVMKERQRIINMNLGNDGQGQNREELFIQAELITTMSVQALASGITSTSVTLDRLDSITRHSGQRGSPLNPNAMPRKTSSHERDRQSRRLSNRDQSSSTSIGSGGEESSDGRSGDENAPNADRGDRGREDESDEEKGTQSSAHAEEDPSGSSSTSEYVTNKEIVAMLYSSVKTRQKRSKKKRGHRGSSRRTNPLCFFCNTAKNALPRFDMNSFTHSAVDCPPRLAIRLQQNLSQDEWLLLMVASAVGRAFPLSLTMDAFASLAAKSSQGSSSTKWHMLNFRNILRRLCDLQIFRMQRIRTGEAWCTFSSSIMRQVVQMYSDQSAWLSVQSQLAATLHTHQNIWFQFTPALISPFVHHLKDTRESLLLVYGCAQKLHQHQNHVAAHKLIHFIKAKLLIRDKLLVEIARKTLEIAEKGSKEQSMDIENQLRRRNNSVGRRGSAFNPNMKMRGESSGDGKDDNGRTSEDFSLIRTESSASSWVSGTSGVSGSTLDSSVSNTRKKRRFGLVANAARNSSGDSVDSSSTSDRLETQESVIVDIDEDGADGVEVGNNFEFAWVYYGNDATQVTMEAAKALDCQLTSHEILHLLILEAKCSMALGLLDSAEYAFQLSEYFVSCISDQVTLLTEQSKLLQEGGYHERSLAVAEVALSHLSGALKEPEECHPTVSNDNLEFSARIQYAQSMFYSGNYTDSLSQYLDLLPFCHARLMSEGEIQAMYGMGRGHFFRGNIALAMSYFHIVAVRSSWTDSPSLRYRVTAYFAQMDFMYGEIPRAREKLRQLAVASARRKLLGPMFRVNMMLMEIALAFHDKDLFHHVEQELRPLFPHNHFESLFLLCQSRFLVQQTLMDSQICVSGPQWKPSLLSARLSSRSSASGNTRHSDDVEASGSVDTLNGAKKSSFKSSSDDIEKISSSSSSTEQSGSSKRKALKRKKQERTKNVFGMQNLLPSLESIPGVVERLEMATEMMRGHNALIALCRQHREAVTAVANANVLIDLDENGAIIGHFHMDPKGFQDDKQLKQHRNLLIESGNASVLALSLILRQQLLPIVQVMQSKKGIRKRTSNFMGSARLFRAFNGGDLIDFLLRQGFCETRDQGTVLVQAMINIQALELIDDTTFHEEFGNMEKDLVLITKLRNMSMDKPSLDKYFINIDSTSVWLRFEEDRATQEFTENLVLNMRKVYLGKARPANELASSITKQVKRILREHLQHSGKAVKYDEVMGSPTFQKYESLIQELQVVDMAVLDDKERKCFFLNLYNAITIHATIVVGYPKDAISRNKFFTTVAYKIGGYNFSMSDIEHGILRGNAKPPFSLRSHWFQDSDPRVTYVLPLDPRIHFAISCGAKSCPAIRPFFVESMEDSLNAAAESFVRNEVSLNVENQTLYMSKIFSWFKSDFGGSNQALIEFVMMYLDEDMLEIINDIIDAAGDLKVRFNSYDWASNSYSMHVKFEEED